ncbi:head completion/stabilization protein [Paraburkholderia bryophila]|uniref:Head completion protein GPL n=1 Tax=Paraburkholderia bryophila TaxID=420952 RepID=A0A329B7U2_9BURK|nr:head completion/stabilization protein [Paraburkholderia bryophila]RAS16067.1 head completion protein GPL [Paraburkholderia bryophila]
MNSFIATAEPTIPATPADAAIVTNDGWFPDIDMNALRASMRLDGTVTHERLRDATIDAIASVNAELGTWQAGHVAAGHADLAAVPAPSIGGESVQLARYRRAVFNLAHADLTERYRDFDSTKSGGQKADELEQTICLSRRNARWAMSDMRGLSRSTIELI